MQIGTVCELMSISILYHDRPVLLNQKHDDHNHHRKNVYQPVAVHYAFCYRINVQHYILCEYNCQKLLTAIQVKR